MLSSDFHAIRSFRLLPINTVVDLRIAQYGLGVFNGLVAALVK